MRRIFVGALALVALGAAACTSINPTTTASANDGGPSYISVAIGDSGATGFRHDQPDLRAQWSQAFYRSTFGTRDVLYDLTSGGQTVAEVLGSVLPQALAVHPQLATVWLGSGDILAGTAPSVYGQELQQLVRALENAGASVLLANAPPPELLPAFSSCQSDSVCAPGGPASPASALASSVSAYDGVIASVARQSSAGLVDVHSALERAQGGGGENLLSPNGTALSEGGASVVARAFEAQLPARFRTAK